MVSASTGNNPNRDSQTVVIHVSKEAIPGALPGDIALRVAQCSQVSFRDLGQKFEALYIETPMAIFKISSSQDGSGLELRAHLKFSGLFAEFNTGDCLLNIESNHKTHLRQGESLRISEREHRGLPIKSLWTTCKEGVTSISDSYASEETLANFRRIRDPLEYKDRLTGDMDLQATDPRMVTLLLRFLNQQIGSSLDDDIPNVSEISKLLERAEGIHVKLNILTPEQIKTALLRTIFETIEVDESGGITINPGNAKQGLNLVIGLIKGATKQVGTVDYDEHNTTIVRCATTLANFLIKGEQPIVAIRIIELAENSLIASSESLSLDVQKLYSLLEAKQEAQFAINEFLGCIETNQRILELYNAESGVLNEDSVTQVVLTIFAIDDCYKKLANEDGRDATTQKLADLYDRNHAVFETMQEDDPGLLQAVKDIVSLHKARQDENSIVSLSEPATILYHAAIGDYDELPIDEAIKRFKETIKQYDSKLGELGIDLSLKLIELYTKKYALFKGVSERLEDVPANIVDSLDVLVQLTNAFVNAQGLPGAELNWNDIYAELDTTDLVGSAIGRLQNEMVNVANEVVKVGTEVESRCQKEEILPSRYKGIFMFMAIAYGALGNTQKAKEYMRKHEHSPE